MPATLMRWGHSMRRAIYLILVTAAVAVLVPQVHSREVPMPSSTESPAASTATATDATPSWVKDSVSKMERELVAKYGDSQRARLQRGLRKSAGFGGAGGGDPLH